MKSFECQLLKNENLTPEVFLLSLKPSEKIDFVAGQAVKVNVTDPSDPTKQTARYFSIASPPESDEVELCIKKVGEVTDYLSSLKTGDGVSIEAPMGEFVLSPKADRHFLFIAMGTGIAPFRSMVLSEAFVKALPRSTKFLAGFRNEEDVLFEKELSALDYLNWLPTLSRPSGSDCFQGRVTDYLKSATDIEWDQTEFYICGSGDLVKDIREILESHGVGEESIHHEPYLRPKK